LNVSGVVGNTDYVEIITQIM